MRSYQEPKFVSHLQRSRMLELLILMINMLLGDGSKHKRQMNNSGMKSKMMRLTKKLKGKSYIKLKKQEIWRHKLNKD